MDCVAALAGESGVEVSEIYDRGQRTVTNDNSENDNMGHLPGPQVFWSNGWLTMIRHCEGIFTLRCNDVLVMPHGTFEQINAYAWAEFDVMGTC